MVSDYNFCKSITIEPSKTGKDYRVVVDMPCVNEKIIFENCVFEEDSFPNIEKVNDKGQCIINIKLKQLIKD